jgi:hypothetical protein
MYLSLVNDLQFIQRLRSFEEDFDAYTYMRDKLKLELEG